MEYKTKCGYKQGLLRETCRSCSCVFHNKEIRHVNPKVSRDYKKDCEGCGKVRTYTDRSNWLRAGPICCSCASIKRYGVKDLTEWEQYKKDVRKETMRVWRQLPNADKRGQLGQNPDAWHIDHKISVAGGYARFVRGLTDGDPKFVGSLKNLRMIPGPDNLKKGPKSLVELTAEDVHFGTWTKYALDNFTKEQRYRMLLGKNYTERT